MEKSASSLNRNSFEHEIGYSQSAILANFIFGGFLLLTGVGLAFWLESWVAAYFSVIGLFLIWRAIRRIRNQGPQLKIGSQGIWTVATGFLPWTKAQAIIKVESGHRSATTYLIILAKGSYGEITRIALEGLDVDARNLQAYLNKYAPKQI
ncbi:hypothetical protein [Hymenobacter negativus]|uniref:PH domain-containing protein n=1 Tax=Hymenobacter negativus TaxID=2795026 RepID=A0ABS0QBL2_9BACT|nr:hypothetical protein [Hymenobacter negativus]MBH8560086.1 hypothetical protein [Hymenobacter negativus]